MVISISSPVTLAFSPVTCIAAQPWRADDARDREIATERMLAVERSRQRDAILMAIWQLGAIGDTVAHTQKSMRRLWSLGNR